MYFILQCSLYFFILISSLVYIKAISISGPNLFRSLSWQYRVQISFRLAGYFCVQSLTLFFAICPHVTLLLTFTEVLVDIFKFFEYTISWLIDLETFPPLFYFYHTFLLKTAASTLILPLRVTHVKMFLNETV